MLFIINVLMGIAIGAGAIIPGVSSGVICVLLGIYEKLIDSILGFFKNYKDNMKFLLPIIVGGIIGIVLFGKILNLILYKYPLQVNFTFIGLIIGSIPSMLKEVNNIEKFKFKNVLFLLCALCIGLIMVWIENNITQTLNIEFSFWYLIFAGMCMSIGVVVPGVSSTVILMLLGVYNLYLASIANVDLMVLMPIIIGLFIGSLFCMIIMKFFFNKFYVQTFYSIIGFTLGAVFVLYPGFSWNVDGLIAVLCFLLGYWVSNIFK